MSRKVWGVALCAMSLVVVACGRDSKSSDSTAAKTTAAAATTQAPATSTQASSAGTTAAPASTEAPTTTKADPCKGATLEETDIGVTKDKLTVLVMADTGSELAPGLFQGAIDGVKAWASYVNAHGGLACRQIDVIPWDSKINATESTNGYLQTCAKAAAMIGSQALFIPDDGIKALNTCPDKSGAATGVAEIPGLAVPAAQQCSDHVFTLGNTAGSCPYSGTGPRTYPVQIGNIKQYASIAGAPLHGLWMIPSDLPSTINSSMPAVRGAMQSGGYTSDSEFGVSGRAEQASFAQYVAALKAKGSNFVYDNSNDQAMIKLRTEAKAQGLDQSKVLWACSLACYTDAFRKDPNVDGTYLTLSYLPYEERSANKDLDAFLTAVGQDFPQSWAVLAWNAGRAFEQAVNSIVETGGPNAVTRKSILEAMPKITKFNNGGWIGDADLSKRMLTPCFVMLQLKGGNFTRVWPKEAGTLDCTASNLTEWTGDSAKEYKG